MKPPLPPTPVTVTACGNARLDGLLAVPEGARGLVLFAHGRGSGRASPRNLQVAEALQGTRIATLVFDLLTPDEGRLGAAEREARIEVGLLAGRLVDASRWAFEREDLEALPLGYFGSSTGATAALLAAAALGGRVRAVVARGGRVDLAGDALGRVTAPALLIVGSADTPQIAANRQAFARLPGEKELVLVPNATHLFEEVGAMETVTHYAVEWFARHLGDARAPAGAQAPQRRIAP
jgi:putative phosphoribosyl transferase